MIMRSNCLSILLLSSLCATAQDQTNALRKFVVADIETRVPIRDAIVVTGAGYRDTTNYRGVCFIPTQFDTLTISRHGYLAEKMLPHEVKDTTFLIPNSKRISEVTVWGKQDNSGMMDGIKEAIEEGVAANNATKGALNFSFDFAKMLDKRYRKDMKHLQKTRQIFKKMDQKDDDPIVAAYKKALEEKRLKDEEQKKAEEQKAQMQQESKQAVEEKKKLTEETQQQLGQ